jgi:tetratricopeptide (TPR) repeat protein
MGNGNIGTVAERRAVFEKAYLLRDRMTERERLLATAGYFASGPSPDRGKAVEAYEALLRRYPDDGPSLQNLAQTLDSRREFARAESLFLRRIEVDSTAQFAPFNILFSQLAQGKIDAAKASLARAERLFPNHPRVGQGYVLIAYAEGQIDSFASMMSRGLRDTLALVRDNSASALSDVWRRQGRLSDAARVRRTHRAERTETATPANILSDSLDSAKLQLWFFDRPDDLSRQVETALRAVPLSSIPPAARPYPALIRLFAAAGKTERARALLREYDEGMTDTVARRLQEFNRQLAQARIALAERRYREAIDLFRASDRRPDGPRNACQICLDPEIGLAFDLAEMPDSSIAFYEHFVNTPDATRWDLDGWELARILRRLGELHEAKGNRAQAISYYQRFVDQWKNADPELQPRVQEIRQRVTRLGTDLERRPPD